VARALGISRFLVPAAPGILCAQGLIASDLKDDIVGSARIRLEKKNLTAIRRILAALKEAADAWFARESVAHADRKVNISFDMRYVGQNFELPVLVGTALGGKLPELNDAEKLRTRFFVVHDQFYGFHNETDPVEIINVRLAASARLAKLSAPRKSKAKAARPRPIRYRPVWFSHSRAVRTPIYDRAGLRPGHTVAGPAIIEQFDSTTVLYPQDHLITDDVMNLLITVAQ
jgi:N-methylhydantoinase A